MRRHSPILLVLAVLVAVTAPVAVVMATGLDDGSVGDEVETADGGGPAGGDEDEDDGGAQDLAARPGDRRATTSSSTAPTTTTSSTSTTSTTATTAPPTTAPPATPAPTEPPAPEPPAPAPPPSSAPVPLPGPDAQVVDLVNVARADAGCGALQVDGRLVAAAQAHSDDMAAQGYFSHTSLDGRSFADRVRAAGYPSPGGENIAQGQRGAQAVHDAWMDSEGHRANILNCGFTTIGVGLHEGTWTWTQNFGY